MKRALLAGALALLVAVGLSAFLLISGGSTRTYSPFPVHKGMTEAQVYSVAGKPYRMGGPYGADCWFYTASKPGTSIDGMTFCFKRGRVSRVQIAVHL